MSTIEGYLPVDWEFPLKEIFRVAS